MVEEGVVEEGPRDGEASKQEVRQRVPPCPACGPTACSRSRCSSPHALPAVQLVSGSTHRGPLGSAPNKRPPKVVLY